jgi:tRNA pseudouridine55 synthase
MVSNGVINVDKPAGITSHDVVARVRRLLPKKTKVGHTGTLDPLATGVLLVAVGSATRLIQFTHGWPKTYETEITLGATSDTDDVTGRITKTPPNLPLSGEEKKFPPDKGEVKGVLKKFTGTIQQTPPAYAAIKIKGKKLYEYARAGEQVEIKPRPITIHALELLEYTYPTLQLRVRCSSGTYIRALARDIGETLGCGGYLTTLRRTAIGSFDTLGSIQLNSLTSETLPQHLQPPQALVAHLPPVVLSAPNVAQLRQGRAVQWDRKEVVTADKPLALYDEKQQLMGIGKIQGHPLLLSPVIILPSPHPTPPLT